MPNIEISVQGKVGGLRIKEFRVEKNWKVQRLATIGETDPKHLKRIEDGFSECSFIVLCRILKAVDLVITDFFDERFNHIYSELLNVGDDVCQG